MAIYRLLQNSAFAPEDIGRLAAAYDDCLRILNLADRSDPLAELLAKKTLKSGRPVCVTRFRSADWRSRK
jgi:hypothetical protein